MGGDGTGIGITLNELLFLKPIWHPKRVTEQPISWGRLDRCIIPSPANVDQRRLVAAAKAFMKQLVMEDSEFRENKQVLLRDHQEYIPPHIFEELCRWLGLMDICSMEWLVLRRILSACATDESVLGIITSTIAEHLANVLQTCDPQRGDAVSDLQQDQTWQKISQLRLYGIGDDIAALITIQLEESSRFCILQRTWNMIQHLCELFFIAHVAATSYLCRYSVIIDAHTL
jgi:hypothetical protein